MERRFNLDIVDWDKVRQVSMMIEDGTMQRGDLEFGPVKVTIYKVTGQGTLRMDFKNKEY
jgi:hypothetical protein